MLRCYLWALGCELHQIVCFLFAHWTTVQIKFPKLTCCHVSITSVMWLSIKTFSWDCASCKKLFRPKQRSVKPMLQSPLICFQNKHMSWWVFLTTRDTVHVNWIFYLGETQQIPVRPRSPLYIWEDSVTDWRPHRSLWGHTLSFKMNIHGEWLRKDLGKICHKLFFVLNFPLGSFPLSEVLWPLTFSHPAFHFSEESIVPRRRFNPAS